MKSMIITTAATMVALLFFAAAQAQVRDTTLLAPPDITRVVPPPPLPLETDYVFVKNGIVRVNEIGKDVNLTMRTKYSCTDGSVVTSKGILKRKDGTKVTLREGDKVFRDGHFVAAQEH